MRAGGTASFRSPPMSFQEMPQPSDKRYVHQQRTPTLSRTVRREAPRMFFFFSNKLGWLGSIAVSIVLTLLLLLLLGVF